MKMWNCRLTDLMVQKRWSTSTVQQLHTSSNWPAMRGRQLSEQAVIPRTEPYNLDWSLALIRWDERAGLRGMRYAPNVRRAQGTMKRRPAMKKTSTVRINGNMIFKGHKLTIGVDLGDRWSNYCVLDEAGEVLLEQKVATTPEGMKQTFERIPRSLIAMETGTHSPWVSRLLKELGHEVLVAHAQKVNLISKSTRKDDRHDARTLARLARIDPELLGPVRHRSAKAQIHLTVIRARAALVIARTALVNAARGLAKSYDHRLHKCGTLQITIALAAELSVELREVIEPLLKEIESLNERTKEYDVRMEKIAGRATRKSR